MLKLVTSITILFSENIRGVLNSLWAPISLFLISTVAAYASFIKDDYSPEKAKQAKRAYLYFDGAHGLFPEMTIATIATVVVAVVSIDDRVQMKGLSDLCHHWQLQSTAQPPMA